MRQVYKVFAVLLSLSCVVFATNAAAATIRITCRAKGQELELCKKAVQEWEKRTGNVVEIIPLPQSSSEAFVVTQQQLSAQTSDVDIFQVDTTWVSFLAAHVVSLKLYFSQQELAAHFPAILQNNTINGELIVAPWYADVDLLFYRKDLLEKYGKLPPTSWEDLFLIAQEIQESERAAGNGRLWGYVFRGKAYEGLMCHVVEWIGAFGGTLYPPDIACIIEVFTFIAQFIPKISPAGTLNYAEEDVRGVFQSGNAIFASNWPYTWALTQTENSPVKGKVGICVLPKGGQHGKCTSVLGGWGLCVSRYSRNQEAAIDLVRWLTRPEEQRRRALHASYCPTIRLLYQDPELLTANPFFRQAGQALETVILRPSSSLGRFYAQASASIVNLVQRVLLCRIAPDMAAQRLEKDIIGFHKRASEMATTKN